MKFSSSLRVLPLVFCILAAGCALGKKEWPEAQQSEDAFTISLVEGVRQDNCLILDIAVNGAAHRLWRASVQYESVGGDDGEGCSGCPFVPRDAVHFSRDQQAFELDGNALHLSICTLDPSKEYRFRVVGKSELASSPLVYTDVYVTSP